MIDLLRFTEEELLCFSSLSVTTAEGNTVSLPVRPEKKTPDTLTLSGTGDAASVRITVSGRENVRIFSVCARSAGFAADDAVMIPLGSIGAEEMTVSRHDTLWWMYPQMIGCPSEIPEKAQMLWFRKGDIHFHLLPLCGNDFRCELDGGILRLSPGKSGIPSLEGTFLSVSAADSAHAAVRNNYRIARARGAVRVPLREERIYPPILEGFGFCTWNAFYCDVTSEKLYRKLDELKEKKIPVRFVILDDGWMVTKGDKLCSFREDRNKIPEGLKAMIERVKKDYGIPYFGVWHAFSGYWAGIAPDSGLYHEQKENISRTESGLYVPSVEEDRAFAFYDAWHSYLAGCGVDFLKVDNQSTYSSQLKETLPTAEACRIAHRAIERSIRKNFGGTVINCMGMDMENVLARPFTAVSRNSDDFFPDRENGFARHLIQNVYNALWHSELYFCDFDMWWSDQPSAVCSGVLRAISGSPIYVSDEIGRSDPGTILPTVEDDGTLMRCDYAARPTADCVYTDCIRENRLLKIWNRSGDCFALAAFDLTGKGLCESLDFAVIPELAAGTEYLAYEYFTGGGTLVRAGTPIRVPVPPEGVRVFSLYPVLRQEDGSGEPFILMGDRHKYVSIASARKTKVFLSELL